jgi:hypothetical protein
MLSLEREEGTTIQEHHACRVMTRKGRHPLSVCPLPFPPPPLPCFARYIRPERKIFKRSIKSKAKSKRVDIRAAIEMSGNEGVATKNLL